MSVRRLISGILKLRVFVVLRVFLALVSFLVALDASIALNRWWLEGGFGEYLQNLVLMIGGFIVFVVLVSKSWVEVVGYVFFCVAVYFICNYEIGGPSKFYLTPLDPVFGIGPAFAHSESSILYRKSMAIGMSLLAAFVLAVAKLMLKKDDLKVT